jgi:AcrR family transcriptional regulator
MPRRTSPRHGTLRPKMRADALENRKRLLDAANTMFREHGIEVSVAEIADAAGVGRGTVFRNFPTKDHLIAAVVSERMLEVLAAWRMLVKSSVDDAELMFTFITEMVVRQQENRALLEAVSDELITHPETYPEMCQAHETLLELMDEVIRRGQAAGSVRPEITPMDVMLLIKGMCMAPSFITEIDDDVILRQIDLIRAALSTPAYSRPLRGSPPPVPTQV